MVRSAEVSFDLLNLPFRNQLPVSSRLNALLNVPILFIQASDDPELSGITRDMFLKAPEPREQAIIGHGNFVSMNDEDKRSYETRVVTFFLTRLPATGNLAAMRHANRPRRFDQHNLHFLDRSEMIDTISA